MISVSISNIFFAGITSDRDLESLARCGVSGLEIAPGRVWPDPRAVTQYEAKRFRQMLERHQVSPSAFHALTFERPDLTLFSSTQSRLELEDHIVGLGRLASFLGCHHLVWGSPTTRSVDQVSDLASKEKWAIESIDRICERLSSFGVDLLLENLWPQQGVWLSGTREILETIVSLGRSNLGLNLDLRASLEAEDDVRWLTESTLRHVRHVHLSDPGLSPPSMLSHAQSTAAQKLSRLDYSGWVALEVRRPASLEAANEPKFVEEMVGVALALMGGSSL